MTIRPPRMPFTLGAMAVVVLLSAGQAMAFPSYRDAWSTAYPGSQTDDNLASSCAICHGASNGTVSTGLLNPYGWDFFLALNAGATPPEALLAIEGLDSDLDPTGSSNLTEINAGTQPGWTPGNNNTIFTFSGNTTPNQPPYSGITGPLDPETTANMPPFADPNGPYNAMVGEPVQFDGAGSADLDGTIVSYAWDFGDGATGTGVTPTHTYATPGDYTVSLTVTDNDGAADTMTTNAFIGVGENVPPFADPNGPYTGFVGVAVQFDGSGSADLDGTITSYAWDFGDGSTGDGVSPSHAYGAAGTYTVRLTVTDNDGASDTMETTATVSDRNLGGGAEVDLDIAKFKVTKQVVGKNQVRIFLKVRNRSKSNAERAATVTGVQNGTEVYSETVMVSGKRGQSPKKFKFPSYKPVADGKIRWTVVIADDDPDEDTKTASTRVQKQRRPVRPRDDDDHDHDRDHD